MIVAGDVTGKGLKAGKLVELLVGAIRMAAETMADPQRILQALNRRLLGRGDAQATCIALRFDADGNAVLANAGHMPPYLNGRMFSIEGSLPLGRMDSTDFSLMRIRLEESDKLVLMSDGIVEATDAEGHLFGFERVSDLLHTARNTEEVASAARKLGREDDNSIICVTRTALHFVALA